MVWQNAHFGYDGYHFGKDEIYNPWSVINFFKEGQIGDYWVNTSGNGIIRLLLQQIQPETRENLFHLLHREVEDIYRFEILDHLPMPLPKTPQKP